MSVARRVYQRYVQSRISVPPRKLGDLLLRTNKIIQEQAELFGRLWDDFERGLEDSQDRRYVMQKLDVDDGTLEYAASQIKRLQEVVDRYIGWVLGPDDYKAWGRLVDTFGHIFGDDNYVQILQKVSDVPDSAIKDATEDTDFPASQIEAYQGMIQASRVILETIKKCYDAIQRQEAYRLSQQRNDDREIALPKHEKIEKLYHASVHARDLYEHGFQAKRPEGGLGLGGSVEDKAGNDAISFTYDQKYAFEISRQFKEMAHIVMGQIKPSQILTWADEEGLAEQVLKNVSGIVSLTDYKMFEKDSLHGGFNRLERRGGKWKVIFEVYDREKQEPVESEGDLNAIFSRKHDVFELYRAFIRANPHREETCGMTTWQLLDLMEKEKVNPRDIGVIVAEVDMADPDIAHYPAERELRVPTKSILKVVKFL